MANVATGAGHFLIPTAPAAGTSVTSGAANTFTTTAVVLSASTSAIYITGVHVEQAAASAATYTTVQLMSGASGAETAIGQYLVPLSTGSTVALGYRPIIPALKVASATRLTVKTADSVGAKASLVTVEAILQSNVINDGIAVTAGTVSDKTGYTVSTVSDKTGYSLTQAFPTNFSSLGIGATGHVTNVDTLTTYTGDTPQTGDAYARLGAAGAGLTALGDTRIAHLDADVSTRLPTSSYTAPDNTRPTNFTALAITAGGAVTAGTVSDKIGYTASTVSDKTGYALTAAYDSAKTAAQAGNAMTLTAGERTSVSDAMLDRDLSVGTDSGSPTVRTVRQALRFLRNKFALSGTTLTVYKEDDLTASWSSTVTTDAQANPVISSDPA